MSKQNSICDIVIFGGRGDLSMLKLHKALYHLFKDGFLNKKSRIFALTTQDISDEEHRYDVQKRLGEHANDFLSRVFCIQLNINEKKSFKKLSEALNENSAKERIFYLSTPPFLYGKACEGLQKWDLVRQKDRVVLEKPIGYDLKSSKEINAEVSKVFPESAIFRIDHYLGKETVQNLLALRFSNALFLPMWNRRNIDHVQITVAETVGIEGRWDYYDGSGALRDMVQNHLLQLLCMIAMEPPVTLKGDDVRDEKLKVLRALRVFKDAEIKKHCVRGQYSAGNIKGESVPGYLEEENANTQSNTETFVALKVDIDNWRWQGVPFYLRTGKRLAKRYSEIVIQFKPVPYSVFPAGSEEGIPPNQLVIRLQPEESIELRIMNKVPGLSEEICLHIVSLELNKRGEERSHGAYEHLFLDIIQNNLTLFMRQDEVEAAWVWCENILNSWDKNFSSLKHYSSGGYGPSSSIALIERDGRSWYES